MNSSVSIAKEDIYREDVYLLKGGKVNTVVSVSEDVLQSNTIVISVLLVHYMSNV